MSCKECGWYESCMKVCFNEKSEYNTEMVEPDHCCNDFEKEWRENEKIS